MRRRVVIGLLTGPRAGAVSLIALALAGVAHPAASQSRLPTPSNTPSPNEAKDTPDKRNTVSEVVVIATQAGAVSGDIKPELQIQPSEIQSYGASTVTGLLDELAPQLQSNRGRGESPVVLLNGRRISGINEIRDVPTEAILRMDILPEEASLKYGYAADQRVINIVLRPTFGAWTAEGAFGGPTQGGQVQRQGKLNLMRIRRDDRLNLDLNVQDSTAITEDERALTGIAPLPFDPLGNVVSPTGGEIDPALSALVGRPVTIAGVPAVAAAGAPLSLSHFAATAGAPNLSEVGQYRTLVASSKSISANAVYTRPIFGGVNATVNATLEATRTGSLQGLPTVSLLVPVGNPFSPFSSPVVVDRSLTSFGPLQKTVDGWTAHLGTTLNRDVAKWQFSLTSAYDHSNIVTSTDTSPNVSALQAGLNAGDPSFDPFAPLDGLIRGLGPKNTAQVRTDAIAAHVLASGPLFSVPAGQLSATFRLGDDQTWLTSSSDRFGARQSLSLARNDVSGSINLDVPLASRTNDVLAWLGDLTMNGNAAFDYLSDFGTLTTLGYGLNWSPLDGLDVIISHTHDEAAPTFQQLGDPGVVTPGVQVFDFVTGHTMTVSEVSGGNTALSSDHRSVTKIGLTFKPISSQDLTITATYIVSRIQSPIETFPAATAQIQNAFPDRFLRDGAGRLVAVDYRPINFASERRSDLRWGINYSRRLGPQPPHQELEGGHRHHGAGGQPTAGRLRFAIYHTVYFQDQMLARHGGPRFDLLNGYPLASGGGQPRHEIQAQAGAQLHGLGAGLSAQWQSATVVRGDGAATSDLAFSDLATIDLWFWADLGQQGRLVARFPWVRGALVTLKLDNLFDQRPQVRTSAGATPLIYQPDYLDPVGRVVKLSLRWQFS
jgi:hypothetical protein